MMVVNKWSDDTPRINKIDVLEIIVRYDEVRRGWRADRIRQLRRRALDEIPTPPGIPRRPKHPNKAPRRTLPDRVLEADLGATDPADAAPAAAPSIAPNAAPAAAPSIASDSAEADGFGVPKTPRHGRKVAGEWGQRHVPTTDAKLSVYEVQAHGHKKTHWRLVHKA